MKMDQPATNLSQVEKKSVILLLVLPILVMTCLWVLRRSELDQAKMAQRRKLWIALITW